MGGCNSCKFLDPKSSKPGRTSGHAFYCTATGRYVNAATEKCDNYEEDIGRSDIEANEIYKQSYDYNDDVPTDACNTCANLDPDKKAPGKGGGYLYYCKKKDTYVNASKDRCEDHEKSYRDSLTDNEIYRNSANYSDNNTPIGNQLIVLVILIIVGVILMIING
jgi:hypothetical protein